VSRRPYLSRSRVRGTPRSARRKPPRPLLLLVVAIAVVCGVAYTLSTGSGPLSGDQGSAPSTVQSSAPTAIATAPGPIVPAPVVPSQPAGLSSAEALALLAALPDAVYTDDGSYSGNREELFGPAWAFDFDGNGCDTRNDILTRDLTGADIDPGTCRVYTGILTDPYTGETIDFVRGQDTSADVQIDHLLPLKAVYATGGEAWTAEKRAALANDPVNLLAVKGSENSSKSDSLPSDWLPGFYPDVSDRHDLGQRVVWDDLPENTALQCWYIDKLVPVFVAYELGVTPQDRAAMTAVLNTCAV